MPLYDLFVTLFAPTEFNLLNAGWLSWLYIDAMPYIRTMTQGTR